MIVDLHAMTVRRLLDEFIVVYRCIATCESHSTHHECAWHAHLKTFLNLRIHVIIFTMSFSIYFDVKPLLLMII